MPSVNPRVRASADCGGHLRRSLAQVATTGASAVTASAVSVVTYAAVSVAAISAAAIAAAIAAR